MTTNPVSNSSGDHRVYPFAVDGRPYQSTTPTLTGAQIKAIAGIDPSYGLFLEGRGSDADRQVSDGDTVDLSVPGRESFYGMAGATYGVGAPAAPGSRVERA